MDPYERSIRRSLGLPDVPTEDEGSDIFQPVRTLFGGLQGAIPAAVSGLMPDQYRAAQEELQQNLGVDENSPWYEQTEALPGAGDVAAQFVPESVKESLPGRVLGPVARLAGNIAGDPSTYTPAILGKAANLIAKGSKAGAAAMGAAEVATAATKARALEAASLGQISAKEAAQVADQARRAGLADVTRALMAESPVRGRAYLAARAIKEAEPFALGTAAALAYGPQVVEAGYEGGKETLRAIGEGDVEGAAVGGANTLLMAGLGYMMGKGLINTTKAKSVLTRELSDQGLVPDIDKMIREQAAETGVAPDLTPVQMPPWAKPAERRARFGETPMPDLPELDLMDPTAPQPPFRGRAGGEGLEGLQREVVEAGPVEGPLPLPLRARLPVEEPTGFRGRVMTDEELAARLLQETERARALAREQAQPGAPEGAAGLPPPDTFVSGRRFAPEPFVGQLTLPGLAEPRPIARTAEPAPRRRPRAKQMPLDMGEGTTIQKPPTRAERAAAEEAKVTEAINLAMDDPEVAARLERETRAGMVAEHEAKVRGKGSKVGVAAERELLASRDMTNPEYAAWYNHHRAAALDRLKNEYRTQVKGGLDPAEMLRAKQLDAEERAAIQAESEALPVETPVETQATPVPEPTVAPTASRIEPVTTEPVAAAPEPVAPIPRAQAPVTETPPVEPNFRRAPDTPIRETTQVEPGRTQPSTPEERMARTPEGWVESLLQEAKPGEKSKVTPEVRAAFVKDPALRTELAARVREFQDAARKEAEAAVGSGAGWTETRARNAVYAALRQFVGEKGLDVKEAGFPLKPKAVVKAPEPVEPKVVAGTPELATTRLGEVPTAPERQAPGAGAQGGSFIRQTTEGPGGPGPKVAARERAAKGGTLSPAAKRWHEDVWPAVKESGTTIEQVLEKYKGQVIRATDKLKLNDKRIEEFIQFQKLYDQALHMGKTPHQARAAAIEGLGGGQHVRNMMGLVENFLGERVVKAAAESQGVPAEAVPTLKALPRDRAGLEKLRDEKAGVDGQLAALVIKGGDPDPAAVQDLLRQYLSVVEKRKLFGRLGTGTIAKQLSDKDLHNFYLAFRDPNVPPLKKRPGAEVVLKALAERFGTTIEELRKGVPKVEKVAGPAKTRLAPEGFTLQARNQPGKPQLHIGPNGSMVKLVGTGDPGRWFIDVAPEGGPKPKTVAALKADVQALIEDPGVVEVHGLDEVRPPEGMKGEEAKAFRKEWSDFIADLVKDKKAELGNLKDGSMKLTPIRSFAGMEARNLLDVAGNDWTIHNSFRDVETGPGGENPTLRRELSDHMLEPEDSWKTVEPIAKSLGLDVKADDPVIPIGRDGWFHQLYLLNGKDKNGQQYVMRIGKSPYLELPRPDQKALVNVPIRTGEFKAVTGGRFTYGVHPYAWSPGVEVVLGSMPRREELVKKFKGYYDSGTLPSKNYEQLMLERVQGRLPDGIGLYDYLDDAAKLNAELDRVGLIDEDLFERRMIWRSGQTGYVKLKSGEAPSGVVRVAPDGSRYKLVVLDLGAVRPLERVGQWSQVPQSMFVALKQADETLPLAAQREIERQLVEAESRGLDLGDGLQVVNHHDHFGLGYTALVGRYGAGAARGMKAIFDDLVETLGPKTKVEFGGLTTSPYLSGLYSEGPKGARVFANVVEAVHASSSYEDAISKMTYTLTHEVAHMAERGNEHGGRFADLEQYAVNLAKAEDWQEAARQKLRDAGFTEEAYRRIREDLVDQFREAQEEINGRDWRNPEAPRASVEGVPRRDAGGSAAAKTNLAGGGAQAPPGGGGVGVRPGGDVPGGSEREAGRLRSAAAAGERDATRPAEGGEVGSFAREGSDPTESFIAGLEARDPGQGLRTYQDGLELLNKLVAPKALDVTTQMKGAWDIATTLSKELPDDEIAKLLKSAPDPRGREGVIAGGVNLLYDIPGVSDRGKARVALYANLMDDAKLTARSKVRSWDKVEKEVRELLGMTTPEEYIKAFQHKGGGITDTEHMALVTARDEILRDGDRLEALWSKAVEADDGAALEKLYPQLRQAMNNEAAAITLVQNKLTGAGRALAVGRHERLKLDPESSLRARLRSGFDELLQSRIRDTVERGKKTAELTNQFWDVLAGRGDQEEFRRALRLAMGRTGMRGNFDKVLEFYKAGLLGWPSEIANISSNALFRGTRFVEDTLAGLFDAGAHKLGLKKSRDFYLGEGAVSLRAMRRATLEGLRPLLESEGKLFKLDGGDLAKMLEQGALAQDLMMAGGAIGGKMGNFFRFHFDSMQNWDTFSKLISKTDSLYRDVYRGLQKTGDDEVKWLTKRKRPGESMIDATERIVGEIRENQANLSKGLAHDGGLLYHSMEMLKRADDAAQKDTFQADLGATGRGVQNLLREHPWMQFLVPFFRTPTNILKETWDRTPAGFGKLALKWNKLTPAERTQSLAKATLGSTIMGTMATLAATGEITGGGPLSFEEREALQATGWQPYSFRAGDQWVSYQRLEPLASLVGMAADAIEAGRNGDMDTMSGAMQKLADSVAENLTNKTFLSGLSSLTGAISDPKRELGNFVKQQQQAMIPNSLGFVPFGHLARAIDPIYREAEPMTLAAWQAKVPFMSQGLAPSYGPTGEERVRPGTAVERAASPFARRPVVEGPKARGSEELVRMGAVPKTPMRYWTSPQGFRVPLKPEERVVLAKALEEATTTIGQRLVNDPAYKNLPKNEDDPAYRYGQMTKRKMLEKMIGRGRARALKQIMPALKQRSRQLYREREV